MELSDLELEKLELYYTDFLPQIERSALEQRMLKEKDYGAAARVFLNGLEGLEMGKIKTHRMYLSALESVLKVSWVRQWRQVAALLALILGGVWFYWEKQTVGPGQTQDIAANFTDHYPRLGNTMEDTKPMTLRDSALNMYEARRYRDAITNMEKWLKKNPDDEEVKFYLGVALVVTKQIDKAEPIFDNLKYTEIEQKDAVLWFLAKCKYELGKMKEAIDLLKIVQATGDRNMIQKADSLISVIEKRPK